MGPCSSTSFHRPEWIVASLSQSTFMPGCHPDVFSNRCHTICAKSLGSPLESFFFLATKHYNVRKVCWKEKEKCLERKRKKRAWKDRIERRGKITILLSMRRAVSKGEQPVDADALGQQMEGGAAHESGDGGLGGQVGERQEGQIPERLQPLGVEHRPRAAHQHHGPAAARLADGL